MGHARPLPRDSRVRPAHEAQKSAGWILMLLGFSSPLWERTQQACCDEQFIARNGRHWAKATLLKFMNIPWDMWQHRNRVLQNMETPVKRRWDVELN
jgi:hypothetical protein